MTQIESFVYDLRYVGLTRLIILIEQLYLFEWSFISKDFFKLFFKFYL